MFEDQNNQVPPNLPVQPNQGAGPKPPKEPLDILGDVDRVEPEVKTPQTPSIAPDLGRLDSRPTVPPAMSKMPDSPVSKEPVFGQKKKIVVVLMVLIIISVLGGAAWYAYATFFASSSAPAAIDQNQQQNTQQQQNVNTAGTQNIGNNNVDTTGQINEEPEVIIDTDKDGLTDAEEATYGTDPTKVDTDLDGLTDRDEVIVFKTDPNNPDSDGDTFIDGEEVRAGYDPKGEGRLLEVTN